MIFSSSSSLSSASLFSVFNFFFVYSSCFFHAFFLLIFIRLLPLVFLHLPFSFSFSSFLAVPLFSFL